MTLCKMQNRPDWFFFKQSWWFFTKGPKSRHRIKRATGTISDFNPKLTSWYKTEAVEQPQGGWRIKEQTGKEYRVTEKQSENWLDAGKTNEDGAHNHKERKTQAKKRGKMPKESHYQKTGSKFKQSNSEVNFSSDGHNPGPGT